MKIITIHCVILAGFILAQCVNIPRYTDITHREINWRFIIPDQYNGFLAIKYECTGGIALPTDGNTILAAFHDDGTLCTTDSSFAWRGQVSVETRSGQSVNTAGLWDQKGYGFYSDGLFTYGGPSPQQFDIFWAGDLAYLASIRNKPLYAEQLDSFLKDRFGIVLPR
jgi:hypothetical protein